MKKQLNPNVIVPWGTKLNLKMKLSLLFLLTTALSLQATTTVHSQKNKITLNLNNATISSVIDEIEANSKFKFLFRTNVVNLERKISINAQKEDISSVLNRIFENTKTSFEIDNRKILLYKSKKEAIPEDEVSIVEQQIEVKGTIVDEQGLPLPGASIVEKGTANGVTTDFDGNFTIRLKGDNPALVISYVGYSTQEIVIGDKTQLSIKMQSDSAALDEVVIVGYGTQKRETVTGSVATVKGRELVKSPSVNLTNTLAGRVSGLFVTQAGAEPGFDDAEITIRGTNTYNNSGALVVIDGIPDRDGGLGRINPADIENVSVLKDASAAIYGARAANGVILVTTKKGKVGKTKVTYSFNQGWASPTQIPDMANAAQYAELVNELRIYELPSSEWQPAYNGFTSTGSYTQPGGNVVNAPWTPEDIELFGNGQDPWGHPNTDWFDETFKNAAPQQKHTIQMSGGSENIQYYTSLGYLNQDAIYKNSATGYEQYDLRLNLNAKISEHVKFSLGVMGREEIRNLPTENVNDIFRMLTRGRPTEVAYWPNGLPGPDIENGQQPVVITTSATGYDREKRDYLQTNGVLDIDIPWVEGLSVQGSVAVDKSFSNQKVWRTPWTLYGWDGTSLGADGLPVLVPGQKGPPEPNLTQSTANTLNIFLGANIKYARGFGDHNFAFLAGTNKETTEFEGFNAFRRYFISPVIDDLFAGGDAEKDNGGFSDRAARLNYFGRVNYDYKEKYLLEFLWRYDGSYLFPENSRYGFFPGVSAGWVLTKESFLENSSFINFLKLRGSWGQLGNDKFDDSDFPLNQYLATYGFNSYFINNSEVTTLAETKVPNSAITWEIARNVNIGIEAKFLDHKLSLEFDVFSNKRSKILTQPSASLPSLSGITPPRQNIGEVENKGFDFYLGYSDNIGDFTYSVSVNGGYAKNKILFNDEAEGAPLWQRQTGNSINSFLVYGYDGVFATQADIDAETLDYSALTNNLRPGDMKFVDYNNDGAITPDDRFRTNKNITPTFTGGLNINAGYRNFDLSLFFQGATGGSIPLAFTEAGTIGNFTTSTYNNRWTVNNPSSVHPRITNRADQYFSQGNTYWLENTNYLRLKNLEFGYTFPEAVIGKMGITNLRFYISGSNLFTISNTTFDPEGINNSGRDYPNSKIINTGFTITF
ncbi:TonB-dependent receptor [Flavivirga algicola]|uniref:TonB-dependent receptor n=1 Tax=Flavivirga algicola TaxID=2729136 RepID=A0ABX1RW88_9FLAO|nr:TonB-dependent receptor [Flavivirga algicola]NMH86754.1 TonB-dependent receptor [Flavivirga algicola]